MRAKDFLLEYSRQITAQKLGPALYSVWAKENKQQVKPAEADMWADHVLDRLELVDPTPHKEYVQWLAKTYAAGKTKFEDLTSRGADALERFQKLKIKKQLRPEHRDIGRFTSFKEFEDIVSSYPDIENTVVDRGQFKEYYRDKDLRIIVPLDKQAACFWGQGTKWCTAARTNNMFDRYAKEGDLYIIMPTNPSGPGKKWQLHFEGNQLMDEEDYPVDPASLVKLYPQLKEVFREQAMRTLFLHFLPNQRVALDAFNRASKNISSLFLEQINKLQPRLMNELERILTKQKLQSRTITHVTKALYDILNDVQSIHELINIIRLRYNWETATDPNSMHDLLSDSVEEWFSENGFTDHLYSFSDNEDFVMDTVMSLITIVADTIAKPTSDYISNKVREAVVNSQ